MHFDSKKGSSLCLLVVWDICSNPSSMGRLQGSLNSHSSPPFRGYIWVNCRSRVRVRVGTCVQVLDNFRPHLGLNSEFRSKSHFSQILIQFGLKTPQKIHKKMQINAKPVCKLIQELPRDLHFLHIKFFHLLMWQHYIFSHFSTKKKETKIYKKWQNANSVKKNMKK